MRFDDGGTLTRSSIMILLACGPLLWFGCASGHLREYELYSRLDDWESAEQSLRKELDEHPDNPELYYLLGRVSGNRGEFAELDAAFRKSLAISDIYAGDIEDQREFFVRETLNRGIEFYNGGDYLEASRVLEEVDTIREGESSHLPYLGICYSALGKDLDARRVLRLSTELNGDELSAEELVFVEQRLRDNAGVIEAGERFLQHSPGNLEVLSALAMAYQEESSDSEAIETYRNILRLDPGNTSARYNMILLLSGERRYQDAVSMLNDLEALEPDNTSLRFNACSLLYDAGRLEESLECFEEYEREYPGDPDALEYLFVLNTDLNRQDRLRELYRELSRLSRPGHGRKEEDDETR